MFGFFWSQNCQKRRQEDQAGESQGQTPPSEAAADEQARGRRVPDVALQETLLRAGAGCGHAEEVPGAGLHLPQAVCVHQRVPGYGAAEEGGLEGGVGALALFKALGLFRLGDCHRGNCEDRLQFLTSFAGFFPSPYLGDQLPVIM